jgi:D-glycero-beta-D-manno-heptose-7-phosphate kinase
VDNTDISSMVREQFAGKRILVVGDAVADQFLNGTIARVSREAPVFILRHDATETRPGAAGNAAANIAALGGHPILVSVIGNDHNGERLSAALASHGVDTAGLVRCDTAPTVTKVRVLAGQNYASRQQVIRIDYENDGQFPADTGNELRERLSEAGLTADAIVISDYNYGVADAETYETAKAIASSRNIPLIVDSRFRLDDLTGATSATPNREEAEKLIGGPVTDDDCENLRIRLGLDALVVTGGNQGMTVHTAGSGPVHLPAVGSAEPVDVTGAGDTVIAAYSLGLACKLDHVTAATIANHAGGLVVMKRGTSVVSSEELIHSLDEQRPNI